MININREVLKYEQPLAWRILENSIRKKRVAHAYLISDISGIYSRQLAFLLGEALLCPVAKERFSFPGCGKCSFCMRIEEQHHLNIVKIEPEGKSIKKEAILWLHEELEQKGLEADAKVIIIDQVETLTVSAANSLLKILEEPFKELYFILLTREIWQTIPTIISRCQTLELMQGSNKLLIEELISYNIPEIRARLLAEVTPNIEESLACEENDWFSKGIDLTLELYRQIFKNKETAYYLVYSKWIKHFIDRKGIEIGLHLLLLLYRDSWNLYLKQDMLLFNLFEKEISEIVRKATLNDLKRGVELLLQAKVKLSSNCNQQLLIEALVAQL